MYIKKKWDSSFPYVIEEKYNLKATSHCFQNQMAIMSLAVEMLCFLKPTHRYSNQVKIYLLQSFFEKKLLLETHFLHVYLKGVTSF